MDTIENLKQDVKEGRVDVARLIDLFAVLQRQLLGAYDQLKTTQQRLESTQQRLESTQQRLESTQQRLESTQQQLKATQRRVEDLEAKIGNATKKLDEPFSVQSEIKRQEAAGKKKGRKAKMRRRGRHKSLDKIARAERTEDIYPEGVPPSECKLSHIRPVWRLEFGRAILIAYRIFRSRSHKYGQIPGVLGRSEYGMEIFIELAQLIYVVNLSFDKACRLLYFFQKLNLRKSQADAMLYQLARHWEHEFDVLCTLLANSLVVHADETSWSIHSVWAMLSEKARLMLFGVHKDGATLKLLLNPETFAGIVISDHAGVYGKFTHTQKCWAHLLRKAIKLTLQDPDNVEYRLLTDRLLNIYHRACRVQRDGRLVDEGRERKVIELDDEIFDLCCPVWMQQLPPLEGLVNDYRLLMNEIMQLAIDKELFTFVTAKAVTQPNGITKPVAGTNNESERTLRASGQSRDTGRTNKTSKGARRQTVMASVLESIRLYLETYTLSSILEEVKRWGTAGQSCFSKLLNKLQLKLPEHSMINLIHPSPSG